MSQSISFCCGLLLCAGLMACSPRNPDNSANTVPIDSTSKNGTAPVQYGPDNPAGDTSTGTNERVVPTNDGTQKHPYSGQDTSANPYRNPNQGNP